jgi:hypothetical protein
MNARASLGYLLIATFIGAGQHDNIADLSGIEALNVAKQSFG